VRWVVVASILFVAACDAHRDPADTPPPPTTVFAAPQTTPTTRAIDYSVVGCSTPPVTFALLCDVVALIGRHHVDAPFPAAELAAGMALGLQGFPATGEGDAVTRFDCAIPDPAFESSCVIVAEKLGSGAFPIEEAVAAGVEAMVAFSLDPFSHYLPPEVAGRLTPEGVVGTLGMVLTIRDQVGSVCRFVEAGCRLEVTAVFAGGPGEVGGLRASDIIVTVDGATVDGWNIVTAAAALGGVPGSTVTVGVERHGDPVTLRLIRQREALPAFQGEIVRPGVAYLRLPDFEVDIPLYLHEGLAAFGEVEHIVLDLRDNPGGLVEVATLVASEFLADGLVLRTEGPLGAFEYPVQPGGRATRGPEVHIVVNRGSASAAEILAAVLQERRRARLYGEPTLGKDTVQIGFPLRNDGELSLTVARWTTPAGASVAGVGVIPDRSVAIPARANSHEVVTLILGK
jgi:carboxyl-terminal processing protease